MTDPHRGAFMALQVTRYPVKGMWSKVYIYIYIYATHSLLILSVLYLNLNVAVLLQ